MRAVARDELDMGKLREVKKRVDEILAVRLSRGRE
jgi:hypothetical protein